MWTVNHAIVTALTMLALCNNALAQSRDPGERLLDEQLRKERIEQLQRSRAGQEITAPKLQGPVKEPVCFPIDEIELKGITIFKAKVFAPLLNEFSNQCLGQASIGILIQRISGFYAEKGYITTRAYVPAQDIASRKLVIEVLEGRIEAFVYSQVDKNGKPKKARTRKVTGAFPIKTGDVFQLRDIEHGLEQINRLASSQANANLTAGQAPGTSRVVITEQKIDTVRATLGFDNRGDEDTGATQLRLGFEVDDLLNINDTYAISYSGSENTNALAFSVSVPFRKWLFSANGSYSESLSPVTPVSDLFTQTSNLTFKAERLLFRDATNKYFAYGSASSYWNDRFINIVALTPQHRSAMRFGFRQEHRLKNVTVLADTSYSFGAKFLSADFDPAIPLPGAPRADYEKLETRITYIRPLKKGRQLVSTFTGQLSSAPLFSEEQLTLGGWDSVRGYTDFSASGDAGFYLRTELSFPTKKLDIRRFGNIFQQIKVWNPLKNALGGIRPFFFFDMGAVAARTTQSSSEMFSMGAGFTMQLGRATLSGTLAMPLKDQNRQKAGNIQALVSLSTKLF